MLKKILGLAPKIEFDSSFSPSKIALKLATSAKTDYAHIDYKKYKGEKHKVLVIFTEEKNMTMENGKLFSTGNHPVESLLPMMHLENAGFDFEIATITGKPVVFEMWAMPHDDTNVVSFFNKYKTQFKTPKKLESFIENSFDKPNEYAAIFIPGGHGAMLGIPNDKNVGEVLNWAHLNESFTISICHGPSSFIATTLNNGKFIYEGYKMAVFPKSVDKMTPSIGYLPGHMPWHLSEKLNELGAIIVNNKADKTVCLDRKLITGASPLASNELGKLAVTSLLKEFN